MGFWKKLGAGLKQGWGVTKQAAPVLPLPEKVKRIIAKGGEVEDDVKAIVDEVKPHKPPAA